MTLCTAAAKNAEAIRAFTEGQNNIDRPAIEALLTVDASFYPGARDVSFEGRETFLDALVGWLDNHENSRFEIRVEIYTDDEAVNPWRFMAKTRSGAEVDTHGIDYFRLRAGEILARARPVRSDATPRPRSAHVTDSRSLP